jgi:hypothetical protein
VKNPPPIMPTPPAKAGSFFGASFPFALAPAKVG